MYSKIDYNNMNYKILQNPTNSPGTQEKKQCVGQYQNRISQSSQFYTMSEQIDISTDIMEIASFPKTPMQCPIAMPFLLLILALLPLLLFFLSHPFLLSLSRSQSRHPGRPPFPYPLHVIPKLLARDPPPALATQRRMLIRIVKRILQQPHVRALHCPKHRLQLRVPQSGAHVAHRRSRYRSGSRR